MLTMIGGVITIVSLLVTRMPDDGAPALPENVTLPDGAQPQAVTIGTDFILIVTQDNRVLIFARDGSFRQELLLAD